MTKLLFVSLIVSLVATAAEPICVRNYGEAICGQFPDTYTMVKPLEEEDLTICARIYSAFFCAGSKKEYNLVESVKGETICVLNTNQPPVSNLCVSTPQFYNYIRAK